MQPGMTASLVLALLLAALMGVAIQRGGTCTVAAMEEIVLRRRATQLLAMLFAALWVAGLLALAGFAGFGMASPPGYALGFGALLGGALLGLGAWINGACAFGTVARVGAGQWAYLATPLGFFAGIWVAAHVLMFNAPMPLSAASTSPSRALAWGLVLAALAAWALQPGRKLAWSPASATLLIGLCFVLLMLSVGGTWTWSETLARWARGMGLSDGSLHLVLVFVLFAGSLLASRAAGSFRSTRPAFRRTLACFCGGALMALGASLAPGSNDTLLLVGLPMFWAYAWVAFGTMGAVIALALIAGRK